MYHCIRCIQDENEGEIQILASQTIGKVNRSNFCLTIVDTFMKLWVCTTQLNLCKQAILYNHLWKEWKESNPFFSIFLHEILFLQCTKLVASAREEVRTLGGLQAVIRMIDLSKKHEKVDQLKCALFTFWMCLKENKLNCEWYDIIQVGSVWLASVESYIFQKLLQLVYKNTISEVFPSHASIVTMICKNTIAHTSSLHSA